MAVYWIIFLLSAVLGIPMCGLCEKKESRTVLLYCILAGAALTLISALRFGVGYDYNLYAGWYYDLNFVDFNELRGDRQEIGLFYLLKLLNIFTSDYAAVFPLISLLIYPPLMTYIYRHSDNPWISAAAFLGMGLFFNSMNFMRQFIAAVICAFAFEYAVKGCRVRYLLLILFASAFHRSALFLLPCFIFVYIDWNMITLAVTAALSAGAYIFSEQALRFVTRFVYSDYKMESSRDMVNGLPILYTVMFGVLFGAAFALRNRMKGEKRSINLIIWCSFAAFFFELIGSRYAIVSRLALLFFIPGVCLGAPKIIAALSDIAEKRKKGAGLAALLAAVLLLSGNYALLINSNYNGIVPYKTIFERAEVK
ncbi:MAG: EpsG family protein [Oscillospiraceae bacterium]|nr:EpsG family protein [Oscillospiraceae bacterium]